MLLSVSNITKYFGAELILSDLSFVVNEGERVGLVGANGVGKSTLLKIITGQLQPDSGAIAINPKTSLGYLPQVIAGYANKTLDELLLDLQGNLAQLTAQLRQLEAQMAYAQGDALAQLMHTYGDLGEQFEQAGGYELDHRVDEVFAGLEISHLPRQRAVSTLSGGEKERVGLAALLLRSPDLLLLDEPTNHISFDVMEKFEKALREFNGPILAVSHDRWFIERFGGQVWEVSTSLSRMSNE
ncbi:MAG: ABC-F family ATP-binding cassette domain-containing protein [Anaerolineae bacterium]|nr:ABC-F family ATP-binding cassette domain-containing protein [Anaerolineae bacterium]